MERLATLQEYDAMGRETNTWLSVPVTVDYVTASLLQTTAQGTDGYSDTHPYNKTVYEASPLNRITSRYGAGAAWHDGHPVATDYLTNTSTAGDTLACKLYTTDGEILSGGTSYYAAATLYMVKTTDEDGNASYTFTDKQDRLLLERRMNGMEQLDTYYVYDNFGNLCFVLQPMYQEDADLDKFAFQYRYDHRNRCVWKKLPGAEYISYTYNDYDQLTFSQDGNQRTSGKWTFYVYDNLNRLTEQGVSNGKNTSGTTMIKNYYDDYSFVGTGMFSNTEFIAGTTDAKGMLTGTMAYSLNVANPVRTVYHYDDKGRVIKTISSNAMGGHEITDTEYSFTGKPISITHMHTARGKAASTEVYTYTYDYQERLLAVTHQLGNNQPITLATYTYDAFGRIVSKKLHNSLHNISYVYNIRNWTTDITSDKFSQAISYKDYYNGNISTINWTANGENHAYTLQYDGISRLTSAYSSKGEDIMNV